MPTYIITHPETGEEYEVKFSKEPSKAEITMVMEQMFQTESSKSLPRKAVEAVGSGIVGVAGGFHGLSGAALSALSDFGFVAGDTLEKMGMERLGKIYKGTGEYYGKASDFFTETSEGMGESATKYGTRYRTPYMLGSVVGQVAPTLPLGVAGAAAGRTLAAPRIAAALKTTAETGKAIPKSIQMLRGAKGSLLSAESLGAMGGTVAGAGAQAGLFTLQEGQEEYLKRHMEENPDLTPEEIRMMAISSALPVAAAAAAKTGAITLGGGVIGGKLMGSLGPEALGAGSKVGAGAIGRMGQAGKFATTNPYGRGITSGAIEGLEEGLDEAIQAVLETKTFREDMTDEERNQRIKDGVLAGFLLGAAIDTTVSKYAIKQNAKAKKEVEKILGPIIAKSKKFRGGMLDWQIQSGVGPLDTKALEAQKKARIEELEKEGLVTEMGVLDPDTPAGTITSPRGAEAIVDARRQQEILKELEDIKLGRKDIVPSEVQGVLDTLGVKTVNEAFQKLTSPEIAPSVEQTPIGKSIIEPRTVPRRHSFDPSTKQFRTLDEGGVLPSKGEGFLAESSFITEPEPAPEPSPLRTQAEIVAQQRAERESIPPQSEGGIGMSFINMLGMKKQTPPATSKRADIRSKYSGGPIMDEPLFGMSSGEVGAYGTKQPSTKSKKSDLSFLEGPQKITEQEQKLIDSKKTGQLLTSEEIRDGKRAAKKRLAAIRNWRRSRSKNIRSLVDPITGTIAEGAIIAGTKAAEKALEAGISNAEVIAAGINAAASVDPRISGLTTEDQDRVKAHIVDRALLSVSPPSWKDIIKVQADVKAADVAEDAEFDIKYEDFIKKQTEILNTPTDQGSYLDSEVSGTVIDNAWTEFLESYSYDNSLSQDIERYNEDRDISSKSLKDYIIDRYIEEEIWKAESYPANGYEYELLDNDPNKVVYETEKDYLDALDKVEELKKDNEDYYLHPQEGARVKISRAAPEWNKGNMFTHMTAYSNLDSILKNGIESRLEFDRLSNTLSRDYRLFFLSPMSFDEYWKSEKEEYHSYTPNQIIKNITNTTTGPHNAGKKAILGWKEEAFNSIPNGINRIEIDYGMGLTGLDDNAKVIRSGPDDAVRGKDTPSIRPEDLFIWTGIKWEPLTEHFKNRKAGRSAEVLKRWSFSVKELRRKLNRDKRTTFYNIGNALGDVAVKITVVAADNALDLALKAINAGSSISKAIDAAYAYINDSSIDKDRFRIYMAGRLDIALSDMSDGATQEEAISSSSLPMQGLTTKEIEENVAEIGPTEITNARDYLNKAKRWFGYAGTADVIESDAAFMGLGNAVKSHVDMSADFQGTLDGMLRKNLNSEQFEAAKPEFEAYWSAKEQGLTLPQLSPEAEQLVSNWQDIAEYTGKISTEEGVVVSEGDKKRKGRFTLGRDYFIRTIRPDYGAILSRLDSSSTMNDSLQEIGDILKEAKLIKDVTVADILKWKNRNSDFTGSHGTVQTQINNFFANLEKARGKESRLPAKLQDFSIGAVERYIYNWSERMAQIKAYGQIKRDGKDLFDVAQNNLESNGYDEEAAYIGKLRMAAYGLDPSGRPVGDSKSAPVEAATILNKFATLVMLTGGFNAIRNLSGMGVTTTVFGAENSVAALYKMTLGEGGFKQAIENSRSAGIILDNTAMLMSGHDFSIEGEGAMAKLDKGLSKATQSALTATGFTGSEYFVRIHADNTAIAFAVEGIGAVRNKDNSGLEKEFKRMTKRLGVDWEKLVQAEIDSKGDTQKFLNNSEVRSYRRKAVKEVQGGYRFDQLPMWMSSNIGRFMFKFGAYGLQVQRAMMRNVWGEMKEGNLFPLIRMLLTAAGSGELLYEIRRMVFGRDRRDATIKEIMKSDRKLSLTFQRLLNDIVYAGTLGTVADISGNLIKFTGGERFKSPLDPAGYAVIGNTFEIAEKLIVAGRAPTFKDAHDYLRQLAALYRNLYYVSGQLAPDTFDSFKMSQAEADRALLRGAASRFAEESGYEKKYPAEGQVESKYSFMYNRVKDQLLIGNVEQARRSAIEAANEMPEDIKDKAWTRVSQSIKSSQPMKIDSLSRREVQDEFFQWAKENLDTESVERIARIQNRYMETAIKAGLVSESPSALKREMKKAMTGSYPKRKFKKPQLTDYERRINEIMSR